MIEFCELDYRKFWLALRWSLKTFLFDSRIHLEDKDAKLNPCLSSSLEIYRGNDFIKKKWIGTKIIRSSMTHASTITRLTLVGNVRSISQFNSIRIRMKIDPTQRQSQRSTRECTVHSAIRALVILRCKWTLIIIVAFHDLSEHISNREHTYSN